jgi:hypothetical protein
VGLWGPENGAWGCGDDHLDDESEGRGGPFISRGPWPPHGGRYERVSRHLSEQRTHHPAASVPVPAPAPGSGLGPDPEPSYLLLFLPVSIPITLHLPMCVLPAMTISLMYFIVAQASRLVRARAMTNTRCLPTERGSVFLMVPSLPCPVVLPPLLSPHCLPPWLPA